MLLISQNKNQETGHEELDVLSESCRLLLTFGSTECRSELLGTL
jgi:hypothetical protein